MNQSTLLPIYERLEALLSKLPGPLQKAVLNELRPIKEIFLTQRLAQLVLLGQSSADASALFSGLLGNELHLVDADAGWITYEQRGRGGFRLLDARRLSDNSLGWGTLAEAVREEPPDQLLFLADGTKGDLKLEIEQGARFVDVGPVRADTGLIGVVIVPGNLSEKEGDAKRLDLQSQLSRNPILAKHLVKCIAASPFVRFRADGTIDTDRDERRDLDVLAELMVRGLPPDSQVEMARLLHATSIQSEIAQRLIRSVTAVCAAVGAQPIPLADFPILTGLQIAMVSGIMHISGRELSLKAAAEFFAAIGVNVGAGIVFRESARAAVKFFPGWGNAVSGGIAAAGTFAVGRAAAGYFLEGVSITEARQLFRDKKVRKTR